MQRTELKSKVKNWDSLSKVGPENVLSFKSFKNPVKKGKKSLEKTPQPKIFRHSQTPLT